MSDLVAVEHVVDAGLVSSIGDLTGDQLVALQHALRDATAEVEDHLGYTLLSGETTQRVVWRLDRDGAGMSYGDTPRREAIAWRRPVTSIETADVLLESGRVFVWESAERAPETVTYTAGYADSDGQPEEAPRLPRHVARVIGNIAVYNLLATGNGSLFSSKVIQLPGGTATIEGAHKDFISKQLRSLSFKHRAIVI